MFCSYQREHLELKGQGCWQNSAACLARGGGGKGSGSALPPAEGQVFRPGAAATLLGIFEEAAWNRLGASRHGGSQAPDLEPEPDLDPDPVPDPDPDPDPVPDPLIFGRLL